MSLLSEVRDNEVPSDFQHLEGVSEESLEVRVKVGAVDGENDVEGSGLQLLDMREALGICGVELEVWVDEFLGAPINLSPADVGTNKLSRVEVPRKIENPAASPAADLKDRLPGEVLQLVVQGSRVVVQLDRELL